jgi:uncharacterized OsmC-like protein
MKCNIEVMCHGGTKSVAKEVKCGETISCNICPPDSNVSKDSMNPFEIFLSSFATCSMTVASMVAGKHNVDLKDAKISAYLELDDKYQPVVLKIDFAGPKIDEAIAQEIEQAMQHSPLHNLISKDMKLEETFTWE